MRRKMTALAVVLLAFPALAAAHVSVRPRESKPSAEEAAPAPTIQTGAAASSAAPGEAAKIEAWLKSYDDAFNAKDLDKLGAFYHPEVTIYEGGGIDKGWASYRDGHLGPELKAFENLQFSHGDRQIQLLGDRSAYVVSSYTLKAKMGDRSIDSGGLETLVLVKDDAGAWKIRHSHTSSRPRRPAGGGNQP